MTIPTKNLTRWVGDENNSAANVARLVRRGIWTSADCASLGVELAEPFVPDDGFQSVGEERFERGADGVVRQVFDVEPIPPVVEMSPAEKLAAAGLTLDDLRVLLDEVQS